MAVRFALIDDVLRWVLVDRGGIVRVGPEYKPGDDLAEPPAAFTGR